MNFWLGFITFGRVTSDVSIGMSVTQSVSRWRIASVYCAFTPTDFPCYTLGFKPIGLVGGIPLETTVPSTRFARMRINAL